MPGLEADVVDRVRAGVRRDGRIVVLTGAGVSAASGIPTFRGPEGWWTVGSVRYTPQQLATAEMFGHRPEAVWSWYLSRLAVVREAEPNPAHDALVDLEAAVGDRFLLVTQNVDGLHRRAGSVRLYEIHGALELLRCAEDCVSELWPLPHQLTTRSPGPELTSADRRALTCPSCGSWLRPHVLWFDEGYDERHFRLESTLAAAEEASLLLTVGTSGATTLPALAVRAAAGAGATLVDVNPEENPFGDAARQAGGAVVREAATDALPKLVEVVTGEAGRSGAGSSR